MGQRCAAGGCAVSRPYNASVPQRLVVRRDWTTEGGGRWRLSWDSGPESGSFVNDQSTVTGRPFYRTMREAIADGVRRHGEWAVKVDY